MELYFQNDPGQMNWLRPDYEYGGVLCPEGLSSIVRNERTENGLRTEIRIENTGKKPVFTGRTDIGIRLPLQDRYESSEICMRSRCHVHIFCGEEISYVCAVRMGGGAPHFGLVLTEGSLCGYSIERDIARMSNDRGCFILHPSPAELLPGDVLKLSWTVFSHEGWEDFFEKAGKYRPFIRVRASRYVLFPGENTDISVETSFEPRSLKVSGKPCGRTCTVRYDEANGESGQGFGAFCPEVTIPVEADGIRTHFRLILQEEPHRLAAGRCLFIARHQQYLGKDTHLYGAYLPYDNEENRLVYSAVYDYNAGRERVGMGLLLIRSLQTDCLGRKGGEADHKDFSSKRIFSDTEAREVRASLERYMAFVNRELADAETGLVANDYRYDDDYKRAYNYPWYALLFTEYCRLTGEKKHLLTACRILKKFYAEGGSRHYSIELPAAMLCRTLSETGMDGELAEMRKLFLEHADEIAGLGCSYPPFEVKFEQSIVAPAAWILLQAFEISGEARYLEAAKEQLSILQLFNGRQPDAHLFETAVRHWDGYWFGKRKRYGDTFPHYWSALSGVCFALYGRLSGEHAWIVRAEHSMRGVLPLISPDGRGSCACIFPETVNGVRGAEYDPMANDQDWGLYLWLREMG